MSKTFSLSNFFTLISASTSISKKQASEVWDAIVNIIVSEVQWNDAITIPNFGRFEKRYSGGKDECTLNESEKIIKDYVPPMETLTFYPSTKLNEQVSAKTTEQMVALAYSENIYDDEEDISLINKNIEAYFLPKLEKAEERKRVRAKKQTEREASGLKDIGYRQPKRIFCKTNGKVYESINQASIQLGLNLNAIVRSITKGENIMGYVFKEISEADYQEYLRLYKNK